MADDLPSISSIEFSEISSFTTDQPQNGLNRVDVSAMIDARLESMKITYEMKHEIDKLAKRFIAIEDENTSLKKIVEEQQVKINEMSDQFDELKTLKLEKTERFGVARFNYKAANDDELSFEPFQFFYDLKPLEDGWCNAKMRDHKTGEEKKGAIPENFLDILYKKREEPNK
ncbi:Oidioi.mRNA.OKI2018_I69.chr1.g2048.t1.cds [Oikopleura dioica]|uniref:Oidioi.mRNA.OKI2018_I69.chr1.g2048.t1.cds n=1 Tax=Oikopleura dioica TaxID=34765 RepID=A0ABN7SYZ4_OIKDI|nr:Oidioi.mRNA.OKI2018_I69.chr1.g2048.t1.cds [Oikopleura dioica]